MNTVIVKVESGIISEVYSSAPVHIIVIDHDVIEGGETTGQRFRKCVSATLPAKPSNLRISKPW